MGDFATCVAEGRASPFWPSTLGVGSPDSAGDSRPVCDRRWSAAERSPHQAMVVE